jgi:hypothetical protein
LLDVLLATGRPPCGEIHEGGVGDRLPCADVAQRRLGRGLGAGEHRDDDALAFEHDLDVVGLGRDGDAVGGGGERGFDEVARRRRCRGRTVGDGDGQLIAYDRVLEPDDAGGADQHCLDAGAAIIASNHLSVSDSIFFPLMIDRPMTYLAKSDYFTGKGIRGWATRVFFKATGQLPIDRSGGKADIGAKLVALASVTAPSYPADKLPPELAALPAVKPGSRHLSA